MNENNDKTKNAVIYCRVSTKEQVDEGNSLVVQEKACKDYAIKNNYNIIRAFIEQGESAKTADRKELQNLISFCSNKSNKISAIIAYKIDRISRNVYDYSHLRVLFKKLRIEIRSVSEHFEDNPAGRFMENIIANVAQFDNDVRAERCVGGMIQAMQEGRYIWYAPLGYKNTRIAGKTNIVPDPDIASSILKAFERVAKNENPTEVTRKQLIKEGLVNRMGKPVSRSQFYRMLKNETYAGWIIKFGQRHRGAFEPIVSEDVFEQVQRVLKYRGKRLFQYNISNPDFPLRRFISHPDGNKLSGAWSKGRTKKYAYYIFRKQNISLKKELLEEKFKTLLNANQLNSSDLERFDKYLRDNLMIESKNKIDARTRLENQIKDLNLQQTLLLQKNFKGLISDAVLKYQSETIEYDLMNKYSDLAQIPKPKMALEKVLKFAKSYLKSPSSIWERAKLNLKQELQWFNFPQGLIFDGVNFRTTKLSRIFNGKGNLFATKSHKVDLVLQNLNPQLLPTSTNNPTSEGKFKDIKNQNDEILQDLERLALIVEKVENPEKLQQQSDLFHDTLANAP